MIALMYHDVVEGDDWDSSGFPGPEAATYKVRSEDFNAHVEAIRSAAGVEGVGLAAEQGGEDGPRVVLTFDDGGVSASSLIAPALEEPGWRAYFFVTTARIGHPGFLSDSLIRQLEARGHVVGAHTHTHPLRMAACTPEQLSHEWQTSAGILGDILGHAITAASVPGGYYSLKVARAAAACGIQTLFNSEPTTRTRLVDGCRVIGRYTLRRDDAPSLPGALAGGHRTARLRQAALWKTKGIAKTLGGKSYLKLREFLLSRG